MPHSVEWYTTKVHW